MSRAATFVAVATTNGDAGRYGVTVSSLTSVSTDGDHPSLLICIHHKSAAATMILQNRAFCANLLAEGQKDLSNLFAGRMDVDNRFDHCDWTEGALNQPVLTGAAASFECELATSVLWESHYIIIGKVKDIILSDSPEVLLYGQRGYRRAVQFSGD